MANIIGVTACPTGIAHTLMAAEALRKVATLKGHSAKIECQGSEGVTDALTDEDVAAADLVVLATDIHVDQVRFTGLPIFETSTSRAIRDTDAVLAEALASIGIAPEAPAAGAPTPAAAAAKRIVAITACPTGIAHTFMAADALKKAAAAAGHDIRVETQGSVGAKNQLTADEIAAADVVIIAADTHVDETRFAGKRVYKTSVGAAVKQAPSVVEQAFTTAAPAGGAAGGRGDYATAVSAAKAQQSEKRAGPYKHLLTGVSYMLPIVVAGGLCIALSFVFGIEAFKEEGTLPAALMAIGGGAAFQIMIPILSGFIAYSIADRPGLAPGLIGGVLAVDLTAGFLGGLISGFLAGYVALLMREKIKVPVHFEGLKPVLIIPLLSTLVVGLLMIYVIGEPVAWINAGMTAYLRGMNDANAIVLGLILGAMMGFDMGGPVNKAAYTFAVGLLASDVFGPMAAVMAAGMVPPLGLSLATFVARNRFSRDEQEAGKAAAVLGISFITEGAIPFAAKDPLRVIPSIMVGAATTGALSMLFGCGLRAPHGGIFVLAIPNAVSNLALYAASIVAGTVVTTVLLIALKRPIAESLPAGAAARA